TNSIRAFAVDTLGNCSPIDRSTVFFVVTKRLIVFASGQGTVSPNLNNQYLEVGGSYSMTATPGAGYVFSNWVGGAGLSMAELSKTRTLNFLMQSNLTVRANFIASPFVSAVGSYSGLYYDANNVQQAGSGFITLTL